MSDLTASSAPSRALLVMPTWIGDAVMATPTLRTLRALWPAAHVAALVRPAVGPILDAAPWIDRFIPWPSGRLRGEAFDVAVLLPNSFRSAWLAWRAGIPKRVGYARDARGWMLTDRLAAARRGRPYVPISAVDYYLELARHLGADATDRSMQLFTEAAHDERARSLLADAGAQPTPDRPLVLLNPGASKVEKRWPAERFAAVVDRCARELGAVSAVTGAPNERDVLDAVLAAADVPIVDLPRLGADLGLLKSLVKLSSVLVTNDTGPRHVAAALGTPVVTLFGPTDPAWARIDCPHESIITAAPYDDPLRPPSRREVAMTRIGVDAVFDEVRLRLAAATTSS